ncbi:enolase C-terminal domain-like protein [Aquisphaera insulae]|uniref:enolase C-terminal domain-like protein n=1 Tax=Aquisphaera insulae TaxID=2712864 RepID=UPI0013EACBF0|nr:enolase C-terminal domain-like protein [Aquisphaera insulae]
MKIASVAALRIRQPEFEDFTWWATSPLDALYEEGRRQRDQGAALFNRTIDSRDDDVFHVLVRVTTDDGLTGLGAIGLGSRAMADAVERLLAPLILGRNPFDVELLWELMFRSTVNIGRKGLILEAISGIDIALWDILGKATGQPVYNLLGGRTREKIRAYASYLYADRDLDRFARMARGYVEAGFTAVKMRFGYGPYDGRAGMRKNVELVRTLREAVGDDVDVMADAYMGWTAQYAIEMIRLLDDYHLAWIEEPVLPDDLDGYARIRASTRTAIAGGEHEFTRYGFKELITRGCVDYVQLDVNRVGGVTEARKIWALAASFSLPVVPHSQNYHNQHLIMAHLNSPLSEYLPPDYRDGDTFLSELFIGDAVARDGHITLSDAPGMGVELNEAVVAEYLLPRDGGSPR